MNNIFVRILLIVLALFGVYKMFPQISKPVDYYVKNPSFQNSVVLPAINTANNVLPDKVKIPTPQVMGTYTDYTADPPLKQITDEVSSKAAQLATEQLNQIKKAASDQFCTILIEKIKADCGVQ
jgi:restriction endonuclease Mrr